jgi:hypothetical protein
MDKTIALTVERTPDTKPKHLTLEELNLFGDMDSLPFSLDDPIWQDREAAMAYLAKMQAKSDEEAANG